MATKKVKKFGRGGDILTGLGAGLAAYGAYKHFFGDKDKEQTSTGRDVSEPAPQDRGRKGEELLRDAIEGKKGDKTDSGRNSNLSPVEQHAAITERSSGVEPSDNKPVSTNDKKPRNQNRNRNRNQNQNQNQNRNQSQSKASSFTGEGMAGSDTRGGSRPKSVVFKKDTEPKKENATINKALKAPALDLKAPKGVDLKGTNKTVYGTDTTTVFQRKAAQERKEKEEAEARKKREAEQAKEFRERQLAPLKKGGMVKKYASGGSVKTAKPTMRSASSRADGIAIRGKTRA